ncbi:hypothetical protein Ancab_031444 [Ancistrocladus abbreviatus]
MKFGESHSHSSVFIAQIGPMVGTMLQQRSWSDSSSMRPRPLKQFNYVNLLLLEQVIVMGFLCSKCLLVAVLVFAFVGNGVLILLMRFWCFLVEMKLYSGFW